MPYWLHSIFGFLIAAGVASTFVTVVLFGLENPPSLLKIKTFWSGFCIVCLFGFPGFAYVAYVNRVPKNRPFGYFVMAGMKNAIVATFLFSLLLVVSPLALGILIFLPLIIPGGALGGYVYGLFRKHIAYK